MKNSIVLGEEKTKELINNGTPYVIRAKMPDWKDLEKTIPDYREKLVETGENPFKKTVTDLVRGTLELDYANVDDKVLLKADGMPTYHLAVVVDDYLMKISHAFRGEEWLPSLPLHVFLWDNLFGLENMPQWAHLPLILKPDGNGKLSKRDGDRLGFPVFAMDWTDPKTNEKTIGFKERGFLPEAFINMLAMMGWNDGTDKEIFSLEELVTAFSMERVHKAGAKFDYEKAKWFNHEWIKKTTDYRLLTIVKPILEDAGINIDDDKKLVTIIGLVKDRCTFLADFIQQSVFFFKQPENIDVAAIKPKWNEQKNLFFAELIRAYELTQFWKHDELEKEFKEIAAVNEIKAGELMLPFRIMLVGGKFGPHVFNIAEVLGKQETLSRIKYCLKLL